MTPASVNGTTIHYRFDGPEAGPVVMLSNSLASNLTMWDLQIPALTGAGYRVLRFDTRGHGQSAVPSGPYSIAMLAADAIGLLDVLGIRKVHFCGLSLGGMIGQALGAFYGERLITLSLCDTSSFMDQPEIWKERIEIVMRDGTKVLADTAIDRWFTQAGQKRLPGEVEKARQMILSTPAAGYCGCGAAIRDLDLREPIRAIKTPTLIIVGEQDEGTPVSASEFIHERIASSILKIIPEAAHLTNVEQSEIFNAILLEFLRSHKA